MKYTKKTTETAYEYIEWDDNGTIRFIPIDKANSDYQAYLKSLEHLTEIPTP